MQPVRQPRKRSFAFERLEPRTVLNGTVTVSIQGSAVLDIEGDAANNAVAVHQVGTNRATGGAIIQVVGLGTKIFNAETGKRGTSFNFGAGAGVDISIFSINLGNGSDSLNLYHTTIANGSSISADQDVVTISNFRCGLFSLSLGGNNVVAINNVTSTAAGFGMTSVTGGNTIALNKVTVEGGSLFLVELTSSGPAPADFNSVAVVNCTAAQAYFSNNGPNSFLSGAGNSFDAQTVDTFQFRFGDLASDKQ